MFGARSKPTVGTTGKVQTLIGEGTEVKGTIQSTGVARIDGYLEGTIEHVGELIVGPKGRLVATVAANELSVAGELRGQVSVTGRLELLPGARLFGDILCGHLVVHDGATFHGQSRMQEREPTEQPMQ